MRVCLIATEIFNHGFYGGFGSLTRKIAKGLAERGIDVYVAMPRINSQKPIEVIDGFTVVSYPCGLYTGLSSCKVYSGIFRLLDADIYHTQEPSLGTCLAQMAVPNKKHIITFQDPRTLDERALEWEKTGISRYNLWKMKIDFTFAQKKLNHCVQRADGLFIQARYVTEKTRKLYKLNKSPEFLPNPVEIPANPPQKAVKPTVCFLGRWDPRKRPEYFFELAKQFPQVDFIAMGGCQPHFRQREISLREKYKGIANLKLLNWAFGEEKARILSKSWILVNTSWRECLPVSYLEASAHQCAILSHENPDDFASNFGYWAKNGNMDDFRKGLEFLLENNRWRELGKRGQEYVKSVHEYKSVIDKHIKIYERLLNI